MRPQIILFGDSITEQSFASGGWGASLADIYRRKVDVVLRGYDGYNTRRLVEDPLKTTVSPNALPSFSLMLINLKQVAVTPAAAVTIFFGANDAALLGGIREKHHVPLQEYKENLRKIVQYIKNWSPNTLVVLITPPPVDLQCRQEYESTSAVPHRRNEVTGTYAEQCVALADELGLPSINLWSKMQQIDGWQTKFLSDGVHLTAEGNAFVLNEVVKIFDRAGLSDLPVDFPHFQEIDAQNPGKALQQFSAV